MYTSLLEGQSALLVHGVVAPPLSAKGAALAREACLTLAIRKARKEVVDIH